MRKRRFEQVSCAVLGLRSAPTEDGQGTKFGAVARNSSLGAQYSAAAARRIDRIARTRRRHKQNLA